MYSITVAIFSENPERLSVLQQRIEGTQVARVVLANLGFPATPADTAVRRLQDSHADIVVIDVDPQGPRLAMQAIELIHSQASASSIFAVGTMNAPSVIVAAMRAGAREYLEHEASSESFGEAFKRHALASSKVRASSSRARILAIANAKGGAGATTVAVNTAIALEQSHGRSVLVDLGVLGHAALHLNVRPSFGIADALQNLHRMDSSLLQSFLTPCKGGLQLLAGPQQPLQLSPSAAELARLFDLLVSNFQYVIVDCSNRSDILFRMISDLSNAVLIVAQADVVSLWSAARIHAYLEQGASRDRVHLIINRFKKIPGFSDDDLYRVTNCKLLWKLPNNFHSVAPAIDKGNPVAFNENTELGRSFKGLAGVLAEAGGSDNSMDLTFAPGKTTTKKPIGNLLISPVRAEQ
jgi:pilus assembly protein CpaE